MNSEVMHWIAQAVDRNAKMPGVPYCGTPAEREAKRLQDRRELAGECADDRRGILLRLLANQDPEAIAIAEAWDLTHRASLIAEVRFVKPYSRTYGGTNGEGLQAALEGIADEADPGGYAEFTAVKALWAHGYDADWVYAYLRVPTCVECDEPGWEQPPGRSWTCARCATEAAANVA